MSSKTFEQSNPANGEPTEVLINTLINPLHVFSGAVSPSDYVDAQVNLIQTLGAETYAQVLLQTLHEEISSLIQEIKMEQDPAVKPNVPFIGEA
jgi:hypothetical protein